MGANGCNLRAVKTFGCTSTKCLSSVLLSPKNTIRRVAVSSVKLLTSRMSLVRWWCHFYLFYFFISLLLMTQNIASSILLNCYQWGSCIPCETHTREPCRISSDCVLEWVLAIYYDTFSVTFFLNSVRVDHSQSWYCWCCIKNLH